ncbi:hypothetical protein CVT24_008617 [Panaeolus cyanescens]|uniref:pyranose dehydrogenase (acceptor) n=1 Tax=Panaeolus cyanescens TaxID=181874 RepID=A0A409VCW3_9AGAR|nr:hypothetical protein CVT24_008617 [Panaeolus cyanescens]
MTSSTSPASSEYDIIFAGGGPCSCIAAVRLLQADPKLRILIIEIGSLTHNVDHHLQPGVAIRQVFNPDVFHFQVGNPSEALGGRSPIILSGKTVGGGSSVNFMVYTRGSASDYEDWEKHGNPGWGPDSIIPLFKKVETYQEEDTNGTHGTSGPIKVSFAPDMITVGNDFLEAGKIYDKERGSTDDVNGFYEVNKYGRWGRFIDKVTGKRSDVPHHYLYDTPEFSTLAILTKSIVESVIIENGRAVGVKYQSLEDPEGATVSVRASKFVVLGAGAFGSPAILERSGIGAANVLKEHDIAQIVDLPGVGQNYMDHMIIYSYYRGSPEIESLDEIFYGGPEQLEPHIKVWKETGQGLISHNAIDAGIKIRPNAEDLRSMSPHLDERWESFYAGAPDKPLTIFWPMSAHLGAPPPSFDHKFFTLSALLCYPEATGFVHISSKDPKARYNFHAGFLDSTADIVALRWSYKKLRELGRRMPCYRGEEPTGHPAFKETSAAAIVADDKPHSADEPNIVYTPEDDEIIDDFLRARVSTSWHSCGTCAMKPRDQGGVVDSRLNVYGVQGLKVADCSIFPGNVGANLYNTALAIGEKSAQLIAEDLGLVV